MTYYFFVWHPDTRWRSSRMILAVMSPHDFFFLRPEVPLLGICSMESIRSIQHGSWFLAALGSATKPGAQPLMSTQDAAAKTARHTQCVIAPPGKRCGLVEQIHQIGGDLKNQQDWVDQRLSLKYLELGSGSQGLDPYSSYLIHVARGSRNHWMFTYLWHFHMVYMNIYFMDIL